MMMNIQVPQNRDLVRISQLNSSNLHICDGAGQVYERDRKSSAPWVSTPDGTAGRHGTQFHS